MASGTAAWLQAAGRTALRFTAGDVLKRPQKIVHDVKRAVADATARPA